MMSHSVELADIGMTFGTTRAVSDVSFKVQAGEFFSILGPSGCGKTTILRMIAGFIQPTDGRVLIGDRDMVGLGPDKRPTAMIFQSLALFPLMSVWENIAFGLEARGMPRAERRKKADELLHLIALDGYGDRMPGELSGGQRQRVAIARALAVEPGVLLLDEPLSALDLKLRQHMRAELRDLQKRTGVTFIYITHDQSEALAMSDRVAVMSNGVLQQVDTPRQLYDNPATPFVARFVGETNALSGSITQVQDGIATIETALGVLHGRAGHGAATGTQGTIYIRPEALTPTATAANTLSAQIQRVDFEGSFALVHGQFDDGAALAASIPSTRLAEAPEPGTRASFSFATEHAVVLADG
jgi:spermidine/putrescine transport system ATP-binding protein